jgi:mono/diheme cytochrome c family protein
MNQGTRTRRLQLSRRMFLALAGLGLAACVQNPSVSPVPIPTLMPGMETGAPTPAGSDAAATTAATATVEVPRPSNPGGPGPALNVAGDPKAGALVFAANCTPCHNQAGHGGVANPGSADGTVPALNPIDPALVNKDPKVFAYNLDLFITHGSTPAGDKPTLSMPAWGDQKKLTDQQIADVIAYVISLNQP